MTRIRELAVEVVVVVAGLVDVDAAEVVVVNSVVVNGHVYASHGQPFGQPDFILTCSQISFLDFLT